MIQFSLCFHLELEVYNEGVSKELISVMLSHFICKNTEVISI